MQGEREDGAEEVLVDEEGTREARITADALEIFVTRQFSQVFDKMPERTKCLKIEFSFWAWVGHCLGHL